ncbi:hypothetical protein NL676_015875 [Syzygium grande]|nr:hypothetical protein NL676_015874 [Syzygium grande]KAI6701551.1 hypothetical protein NL676_015875 [Syzygium grande]
MVVWNYNGEELKRTATNLAVREGGVGAAIGVAGVRELRYHNSSGRQRHRSSNNNSSSQLGAGVVTRGWKGE